MGRLYFFLSGLSLMVTGFLLVVGWNSKPPIYNEVTCKETEMKNLCYCSGEGSCAFTERCDTAERAGFTVIYRAERLSDVD